MIRRGLMVFVTVLALGLPAIAETGTEPDQTRFMADSVDLLCDSLDRNIPIRILVPERYRWDDEVYTQLVVMDSRSDEQIAGLVSGFVASHDDILPMVIIRVPDSVFDNTPVKDWMAFLNDKVFPYVEANYRTRPFRVLAGDRLTAQEAIALGTKHYKTIHGVVALGVTEKPLSDKRIAEAIQSFSNQTSQRLSLFMVAKDEAGQIAPFSSMEKELESEKDMRVRLVVYNAKSGGNRAETGALLHKGLGFCYTDWFVRGDLTRLGVKGLEAHYRGLSRLTGVEIAPPESILDRLAYAYQMNGQGMLAMQALKYNVRLHPRSAEAYAAIGQSWSENKRFRVAIMRFKQAVSVAEETNNPQLSEYKAMLKDTYQKINYMQGVGFTEGGAMHKITGGLQ